MKKDIKNYGVDKKQTHKQSLTQNYYFYKLLKRIDFSKQEDEDIAELIMITNKIAREKAGDPKFTKKWKNGKWRSEMINEFMKQEKIRQERANIGVILLGDNK